MRDSRAWFTYWDEVIFQANDISDLNVFPLGNLNLNVEKNDSSVYKFFKLAGQGIWIMLSGSKNSGEGIHLRGSQPEGQPADD